MLKDEESQVGHFNCSEDGDDGPVSPGPLLLPDVIRPLCKFLRLRDIKQCRLVCQSWNYGATPVLKARSMIKIHVQQKDGKWAGIVDKLQFCPINIFFINWRDIQPEQPIQAPIDLNIFPLVKTLKVIRLCLPKAERWLVDLSEKMILASSTTLEELRFDWDHRQDFPVFSDTVFPRLRRLAIDYKYYKEQFGTQCVERIGRSITELFPCLEQLKIQATNLDEISKMGLLPKFPRSLTSLVLSGALSGGLDDPHELECLVKFPVTLKKLVFYQVVFDGDVYLVNELPMIMYKLLNKHSPTLEKLSIDLSLANESEALEWKFPVFPALKKLKICDHTKLHNLKFEKGRGSGSFGRIDYTVCFPVLESLYFSIESNNLGNVTPFIPPKAGRLAVLSVTKVETFIHLFHGRDTSEHKLARARLFLRLLEIFPNARDSLIKNSRKSF